MDTKQDIRGKILALREKLSPQEWQEKTRQITDRVTADSGFREAADIFCYADFRGEAGTAAIMAEAWKLGKNVWVPKVFGDNMEFFQICPGQKFVPGFFGVPEPEDLSVQADGSDGLVIVPGVAFDPAGNRIGYGRGYYDRYLTAHPKLDTLGIAFALQIVEQIPCEPLDRKIHRIITETDVYEAAEKDKATN